jgi:predicted nuclease of predicted toxin-antitoxin system
LKKRSDTKPPEYTFFIDRSMGRKLADALGAAGLSAIAHDSIFDEDTPDEDWLARAGREEWVVLTKDQWIRRRPIERRALRRARVRAFVFTGGNVSGIEMAEIILEALPRIRRLLKTTPAPFLARISASGDVVLVEDE